MGQSQRWQWSVSSQCSSWCGGGCCCVPCSVFFVLCFSAAGSVTRLLVSAVSTPPAASSVRHVTLLYVDMGQVELVAAAVGECNAWQSEYSNRVDIDQ